MGKNTDQTVYIGLKLSKEMKEKIKNEAAQNFCPESSIIKQALNFYFTQKVKQSQLHK